MWSSTGAAIGVVSELMNVNPSLGIRIVASNVPGDGGGRVFGGLLKVYNTLDVGVPADDSDCEGKYSISFLLTGQ